MDDPIPNMRLLISESLVKIHSHKICRLPKNHLKIPKNQIFDRKRRKFSLFIMLKNVVEILSLDARNRQENVQNQSLCVTSFYLQG